MWGSKPETAEKVGKTTLGDSGELKLHRFMDLHTKGDSSTGVYGDNKDTRSTSDKEVSRVRIKE